MRLPIGMLLPLLACACVGTRTGNPTSAGLPVPKGAELVRSKLERQASPKLSDADAVSFGADNRAFAWDLYGALALDDRDQNLFFSPYSISTALAMSYAGARGNTESEMATALHFTLAQRELHAAFNATDLALRKRQSQLLTDASEPVKGDGFRLELVNQAWGQKGYEFLDGYLDTLGTNYGAGLLLIDFAQSEATRQLINGWVEAQTEQRIRELLPQGALSSDTALVLTNAIYFKASWLKRFDPANTQQESFQTPTTQRSVAMMHQALVARYARGDQYQAVELRYLSPDVRMLLVLPDAEQFSAVATRFAAAEQASVTAQLTDHYVTLSLPKWQFESRHALKAPLQQLGMHSAFVGGQADFSGMDGVPGYLFIDQVFHDAFVAVDENGTEAAAATAVVSTRLSAPAPVTVRFDRPFLFVIYDAQTGQNLFLGHVVDPG